MKIDSIVGLSIIGIALIYVIKVSLKRKNEEEAYKENIKSNIRHMVSKSAFNDSQKTFILSNLNRMSLEQLKKIESLVINSFYGDGWHFTRI